MVPLLLSGPAAEPLTLAEAKLFLRVSGPEEDALIADLLRAARAAVEGETGFVLVREVWRLAFDGWPPDGRILVPLRPLAAVAAARVRNGASPATEIAPETFRLDPGAGAILVAGPVPPPGQPAGGVEIDAGFGAETPAGAPPALVQAVRLTLAHWFEHRGDGPASDLPPAARAIAGRYRRRRLA
jgi:uncharacterized phiE125 gp8 family phage protein